MHPIRSSQRGLPWRCCFALALLAFSLLPALFAQDPAAQNPPAKLEGHTLFTEKGCAQCHGPEALGTARGPGLRTLGRKMKPEDIRHQIVDGGKEMPAFGEALTPEETDALIAWVHTLKPPAKTLRLPADHPSRSPQSQ